MQVDSTYGTPSYFGYEKNMYGCEKDPGNHCLNRQMPDKPYTTPQQTRKPQKITYSDLSSCSCKSKYPVHV